MKRALKFSSLFLILLCVFMLFACSNNPNENVPEPEPTKPVEATVAQKVLVQNVIQDFTYTSDPTDPDAPPAFLRSLIAKLATVDYSAVTELEKDNVKVNINLGENKELKSLTVTYNGYNLDKGTVTGSVSMAFSNVTSPTVNGELVLSGYSTDLDGTYAIEIKQVTNEYGYPDTSVTLKKNDKEINLNSPDFDFKPYVPVLKQLGKGAINAAISEFTVNSNGVKVNIKGAVDFVGEDMTITLSSVYSIEDFFTCNNRTYSLSSDSQASITIGKVESSYIPKSGTVTVNSASLVVGNNTISFENISVDIAELISVIKADEDGSLTYQYIMETLNTGFKINGQLVDINSVIPKE